MVGKIFTWAAVGLFALSAWLWFASTLVKVGRQEALHQHREEHGPDDWEPAQIIGDNDSDFYATVQRQARWSRWAALATGAAVACQAVALAIT